MESTSELCRIAEHLLSFDDIIGQRYKDLDWSKEQAERNMSHYGFNQSYKDGFQDGVELARSILANKYYDLPWYFEDRVQPTTKTKAFKLWFIKKYNLLFNATRIIKDNK